MRRFLPSWLLRMAAEKVRLVPSQGSSEPRTTLREVTALYFDLCQESPKLFSVAAFQALATSHPIPPSHTCLASLNSLLTFRVFYFFLLPNLCMGFSSLPFLHGANFCPPVECKLLLNC